MDKYDINLNRLEHGLQGFHGYVYPKQKSINSWQFTEDIIDEAMLAEAMMRVGEKNGVTVNDMQHLFPAVLRMLKSKSEWSE